MKNKKTTLTNANSCNQDEKLCIASNSTKTEIKDIDEVIFVDDNNSNDNFLDEEIKSSYKKKMTKSGIIITSTVSTIAICAGIGLGVYFGNGYFDKVNYNYDVNALEDNISKIMSKYEKSNSDYSSLNAIEMANVGIYQFANKTYTSSSAIGEVRAEITQTICTSSVKKDNSYFNESISASSLVKVAKRFYQNNNSVSIYEGSIKDTTSATWNESSKQDFNLEQYETEWGRTLSRPMIYIISSKTVINYEKSQNENGDYIVSFELDPIKSVVRYVKQMSKMSNLSKPPQFTSIYINLTLSNNLMLKESNIKEEYSVYMFGNHKSVSTLQEKFATHDEPVSIPDLNTDCNY